ncbi:MAG: hypothetical protein WCE80_07535, partial [Acidimicrobiia bacterium]
CPPTRADWMSLVVFPFKSEELAVVATNLAIAARNDHVREIWAVAAEDDVTMAQVATVASSISAAEAKPVRVFPEERIGALRPGKGDAMNTAIARSAERGFERTHFYDADITNFDSGWIDGAESAADHGYQVVRHRFPRAATDAMITWMITRPGLAMIFPGTLLPRLGQPLGGEMLLTLPAITSLAEDPFVRNRSDWGIDTVITHATATMGAGVYEHYVPDGKRHALYGSLTDIRQMLLECLDAVASLSGHRGPAVDPALASEPGAPVPKDLKRTEAYDLDATRRAISDPPGPGERAILDALPGGGEDLDAMDEERWGLLLPGLLSEFALGEEAWEKAVFRLWASRVIHYTTHHVPQGYDQAMEYLETTIRRYEAMGHQDDRP